MICYSVRELLTFLEGEHDVYKKIQVKIARRITAALKRAAKRIGEVEKEVEKRLSTPERHASGSQGTPLIFCRLKNILLYCKQRRTKTPTLMGNLKMKTRKAHRAARPNLRVNIPPLWVALFG